MFKLNGMSDIIAGIGKKREEHIKVPRSNYVALIKDFDRKLDEIHQQLSHMKLILFELTEGEYNPFTDVGESADNIDMKLKQHAEMFGNKIDMQLKQAQQQIEANSFDDEKVLEFFNKSSKTKKSTLDRYLIKMAKNVDAKEVEKSTQNSLGEFFAEESKQFVFSDGCKAGNLSDLYNHIRDSDDNLFRSHVADDKNDFASWVEHVLDDKSLAEKMQKSPSKEQMLQEIKSHLS